MGIIDNISSAVNRGTGSANRAAEKVKVKARLAEINKQRIDLAAQLGASVYEVTKSNPQMQVGREQLYAGIASLDAERNACEQYIAMLDQQALASRPISCPSCGNRIQGGSSFCPLCGTPIMQQQQQIYGAQQQGYGQQQQAYQTAFAGTSAAPQGAAPYGEVSQAFQGTVDYSVVSQIPQSATMLNYPQQAPQVASAQTISPSGRLPFSGPAILAIICAALALVCAFLPWFSTSSSLQGMGNIGNALGQFGSALTGQSYGNLAFEDSYAVYQFLDLAKVLSNYSSGSSGGVNFLPMFFGCWLAGLVAIATGAVVMLCTKHHIGTVLVIGALIMAAVCIFWACMYGLYVKGGAATGFPTFAVLCAVACGGAALMAIIARVVRS